MPTVFIFSICAGGTLAGTTDPADVLVVNAVAILQHFCLSALNVKRPPPFSFSIKKDW